MMRIRITLLTIFCIIPFICSCSNKENEVEKKGQFILPSNSIVVAEQARRSVVIIDADTQKEVWRWNPQTSTLPSEKYTWFHNPSEVKPVCNNRYILMTASGGAVALLRIADKKVMFYAYAGVNPHSAELLPDGNIVAVSSTDAKLSTFVTDTIRGTGEAKHTYQLPTAHNIVWDKKQKKLLTTENNALYAFDYNFDKANPQLINKQKVLDIPLSESCGHDLFPIYGEENKLWLTTNESVWVCNLANKTLEKKSSLYAIKSVSNGPLGIIMLYPTVDWHSDCLINEKGEKVLTLPGTKIYKGRWMLPNSFSY